jgi:hypothetical protein
MAARMGLTKTATGKPRLRLDNHDLDNGGIYQEAANV